MTNDNRRTRWMLDGTVLQAIAMFLAMTACVLVCVTSLPCAAQNLRMLRFVSAGPIQIAITDPEGHVVSREANEIEGAVFIDGDREVIIEIPHSIAGIYEVDANVSGSANRLQRFDVSVTDDVNTLVLAERELIANVPRDPYLVRNDQDGFVLAQASSDDSEEASISPIWFLLGGAVLLAGITLVILRFRKQRR